MNAGCFFSLRCNHIGHPWVLCPKEIKHFARQGSLKMYAEGGHHPQQELDRFGHRSERKVENFKNPLCFGHFAGTYCLNMTNPNNIFSKSGNFGAFFL